MSKWKPLLDCVNISGYATPYFEDTKYYVSTGALNVNIIDYSAIEEVTYQNKPSRANLSVDEGTILFAKMKETHKTLLVTDIEKQYIFSTGFYALKPKDNLIDLKYLFTIINSEHFLKQKDKYCTGATQKALNNEGLRKIQIPLPPLDEQKKIANELDKITSLIEKRKAQIEKLDLLIKSKFVEMFGDPVTNPMGWDVQKIFNALCVQPQNGLYKPASDYVDDNSETAILRIDAFYNGKVTDYTRLKRLKCTEKEIEKYCLAENDIVINRVNSLEYLGKCAHIVNLHEQVVFESNMMRMHFNENKYNAIYVTHLLCTEFIYEQIVSHAKKAVNQASINQKDVQDFDIYCPPLKLQNQFADYVQRVETTKTAMQQSLEKLEILKKARMQFYFE